MLTPPIMKHMRFGPVAALALAAAVLGSTGAAHAARAEPMDLETEHMATLAKEKVKQSRETRRGDSAGDSSGARSSRGSDQCGHLDIANDDGRQSARERMRDRDKTVIVAGPVINAARCR